MLILSVNGPLIGSNKLTQLILTSDEEKSRSLKLPREVEWKGNDVPFVTKVAPHKQETNNNHLITVLTDVCIQLPVNILIDYNDGN